MEIAFDRWIVAEAPLAASPALPNPCLEPGSDEALMGHFQRGDEAAFRHLYDRYRSPLLRFVQRLVPDAGESEEVAQETWMAVIRGRERYSPRARFVTYLFSIAHRRAMDRWRKRGRWPETQLNAADEIPGSCIHEPEWRSQNQALGAALLAAISALPLLQREAFLLRAEAGLGIEEIARVTGTNLETAKSRLRYALRRLRASLESWK
ncbi:MAG: sigma-70 family RNA polymerase sigma factor [Pseudomonadota bacterium]